MGQETLHKNKIVASIASTLLRISKKLSLAKKKEEEQRPQSLRPKKALCCVTYVTKEFDITYRINAI